MKSKYEIQRAHDILEAFLTGEVPTEMTPYTIDTLNHIRNTLCWILGHKRGDATAKLIEGLIHVKAAILEAEQEGHAE